MSSFSSLIGDTLAQVNQVRRAFGKEPLTELPDARPGDTQDCLYYRGLADCGIEEVSAGYMRFGSERQTRLVAELWGTDFDGETLRSPANFRRVIHEFDSNHTPHYDV